MTASCEAAKYVLNQETDAYIVEYSLLVFV